ncbi:beta-ketoacyl synthase N-terminal-like domain-containing protein, partial [Streptomyces sp. B1866]|uniref:polyketide synthase n=1 Tax=Streptomyces sp. B1866 TaxID=3075431 RepID=UPI0028913A25
MTSLAHPPTVVIGLTPLGRPDPRLAAAVCQAGALGVLDLGTGDRGAREALALVHRWVPGRFGVRVAEGCALTPADLPAEDGPHTVVLAAGAPWQVADLAEDHHVLVEVGSPEEAARAAADGAHGLIARGSESGGRVADLSTFVLLQRLLADPGVTLPVWACGGIGPRTAAAAVLGGAAGVVLDTQLALLAESGLPEETAAVLRTMDGTETAVEDGRRVLRRRGAPADAPALPVGQDGFLAARFADRWRDAAGAVRAVRTAIEEAAADPGPAAALLRPGAPMGEALGTGRAIAQGPMTRVSDQPGFAAAVAAGGGLPFLALALMTGEQTRDLLRRTRAELGDAPWGVGILGFVDEETRAAQLAEVREARPSHAIIAGGRPAQAAALEEAGIRTFLHVPSPGLLRQFLDAGARRFVFEGAECGGHVGPRSSFALWEAQLAVLEDYPADGVEVLFAGGVHDERSAAMVAALAAPLAARGAAVGVLMGTAYLFTEEAVARGAVGPLFQRQVVAAEATALLETAPGHATRCVRSPFTDEFAAAKEDLRRVGTDGRVAWAELEKLTVGRLRTAAKGVERVGDELVAVDEDQQLRLGMFMAGDVALLRSATTTVGDLHHAVGPAAADHLDQAAARERARLGLTAPEQEPAPAPLDIAVVGMSCVFPQSDGLADYWAKVLDGADAVTEVPVERWDPAAYPDCPSHWGGFLPRIPFDPLAYGIPPASLGAIEPVQLLALDIARRALEDAGYGGGARAFDRARTSVVFGAEAGSDLSNATTLRTVLPSYLHEVPQALEEQLPKLTEDSFPGVLANVITGRIANRLDLGGANYTVDAACASSLAAVDVACQQLVAGASDMVLCGGADLHNGINDFLMFASVGALSPTGRSRTFDASADGIALGEGVACVVLKRLVDAERDGDRIYAVLKGLGSASDGRSLGLTAPRPEGQRAALERAYTGAGISPAEVGLVEAHGTGTVVGDRTELTTLTTVFAEAGAEAGGCALGSVKSQIGHTKCAAGLAGLIKAALAVHTGVLPPTRNLERPNPAYDAGSSPFVFHTEARPWAVPAGERYAGVSAFGFGGTNFHAVLAGHERGAPPAVSRDTWPAELFTFRGRDLAAAQRDARRLLERIEGPGGQDARLRDIALTAARAADPRPEQVRIALVASGTEELTTLLRRALAGEQDPRAGLFLADEQTAGEDTGKVALLFPGQGSQRPGMFADLLVAFPEAQAHLQRGRRYAPVVFPPAAFDRETAERQRAAVTDTRVAQPALGIAGLVAHDLLTRAGIRADMAAGHSYGELMALCAAGALTPEALLDASARRAESILASVGDDPGTMAAVAAPADDVERALAEAGLAGQVVAANRNAPKQTMISGPVAAVGEAVRLLREAGLGVKPVPVACAFHSPLVAGAGERFAEALAGLPLRAPEFPVWANRTAAAYPAEPDAIRAELAAQIGAPVRFTEQIEAMYEAGARIFVEAGPGTVLTNLVKEILGDRPHRVVAVEPRRDAGLRGLLDALARLAVAGLPVRTAWLLHGRDARPLPDATAARAARRPGWTVDGHLVRTAAGEPLPGGLAPARRVHLETTVTRPDHSAGYQPGSPARDTDALIAEFLRSSREMVAAQRDVLLTYFGAAQAPAPVPPLPGTVLPALPQQQAAPLAEAAPAVSAPVAVPAAPAPAPVAVTA